MFAPLNRPHPSPRLRLQRKSLPLLTAAVSCVALLGPQLGCDNASSVADRKVEAQVDESRGAAAPREGELPAVPAVLNQAITNSAASPATRAETLAWLGQAEVQRASALLDRAGRDEVAARRLISEINRLTARLQSNATVIAGLQKLEPSKERAALQETRGAIQGEQDPVWIKHETGALPALKGVEERLAALQDQIGKLEQQSKDLAGQRSRQLAEAERLERQSEEAKGQQSVDLFNQSAAARKKAADLGVQVDGLEAKLVPLRQDQQLAQNEQQQLTKAVQAFDARLQGADQNWKTVQQQIEALNALSKAIVGPNPNEPAAPPDDAAAGAGAGGDAGASAAPAGGEEASAAAPAAPKPATRPGGGGAAAAAWVTPTSLAGKLRWLSHISKSIETQRGEAETLLNSALTHYKTAGDAARSLQDSLSKQMNAAGASQRPEKPSWQRLADLHNPSEYKLKQGAVQLMLAGLARDRAALLAARANVAKTLGPVLQANKVPAPPELAENNVEPQVAAAREASKKAYEEADALLTDVVENKSGDAMTRAARAGHALRLAGLYGRAQLAAGSNPQEAAQWIAKAKQLATSAEGDLPAAAALPAVIQDVLELRAPPTTTPPGGRAPGTPPAPAPTIRTPPTTPAPAPAPTTPTPAAPTPDTAAPAPGAETPAAPAQPAPGQPAPGAEQPAPPADGTAAPAAPDGQQPAPAPAPAPQEGAQPASDSGTPAPAPQDGAQPPADSGTPAPAPADGGAPPAGDK